MLVDAAGIKRDVDKLAIAQQVTTQGVTRDNIAFAPHDDRRYDYNLFDGTLGRSRTCASCATTRCRGTSR